MVVAILCDLKSSNSSFMILYGACDEFDIFSFNALAVLALGGNLVGNFTE